MLIEILSQNDLFQHLVMLFCTKNKPATLQQKMSNVTVWLEGNDAHIDDLMLYSEIVWIPYHY